MNETDDEWKKGVPPRLIRAITSLRESFDDVHGACAETTRRFCYARLHDEIPDDPAKEYFNWLMSMKAAIGPVASRQFNDLIRAKTPPAIFKAFYDLYVERMSAQAALVFRELMKIGRAHEERLGLPVLEWAEAQVKHLIRSYRQQVENWVREVCDMHIPDPNEDAEEQIFWRRWQAPSLIMMKPSRNRPYDAEKVWERNDHETSAQWLKVFQDDYVLRLEMRIRRVAGEAAVAFAKQPKQTQRGQADPVGPNPNQGDSARGRSAASEQPTPNTVRREARMLETQAKYRRWQAEYRRLKSKRKGESDVWYAQQIAKLPIADGRSAETVRKHMTQK